MLSEEYGKYVGIAETQLAAGDYAQAADHYTKAFTYYKGKGPIPDRLNAARAYAYSGQSAAAITSLQLLCETERYFDHPLLQKDKAFEGLRNNPQFLQILQCIRTNQEKHAPRYNPGMRDKLLELLKADQDARLAFDAASNNNPSEAVVKEAILRLQAVDSANTAYVSGILNTYGWPDKYTVDFTGCNAIFLIIQHAPLAVQKKYLPMLQQAAKTYDIPPANLALLTDKISVSENGTQLYGTQIMISPSGEKTFYPITGEAEVNKRRKEVGLPPLEDYLKMFGISYVPKQEEGK